MHETMMNNSFYCFTSNHLLPLVDYRICSFS